MRERRDAAQRRAQGINHRDGLHGLAKGAGVVAKRNPNTLAKRRNRAKDELLTQARGDLPAGAEEEGGAGLVLQVHEGQRAILEPLVPGALHCMQILEAARSRFSVQAARMRRGTPQPPTS